ncbi:MAG: DNA topoisomerase I, partial [Candidatus Bathyarchaeia archaeon]
GVPYYEAKNGDRQLMIVPALGHLYTVAPKMKDRSIYPVFDFQWQPKFLVERGSDQTRIWIEVISRLSKEASDFILATDYDIEGATLGYTILKYACGGKEKEAKRMKFSTLTAEELVGSYEKLLPHIEFPVVEAGLCRHFVDAMYGINLSRAMTIAAKHWSGKYATLSTGRVQGPTLSFLVTREKEINSFVPTPFWTIRARVVIDGSIYELEYEKDMITRIDEANAIVKDCKGKTGKIISVKTREFRRAPPTPFDLGTLQTEAYSHFRYTPKRTANIAERLYLEALISYPRTSSQKLPPSINYEAILKSLRQKPKYKKLASDLLKLKVLKPNEGKKEDPAHPAVYPTGNLPERPLSDPERRIWDLVVRRFMAVFGEAAVKRSVKVSLDVNGHRFYLRGRQIVKEGWMRFYRPYVRDEDVILPHLEEGGEVEIVEIIREDKFTKPPSRHNPSSLLKMMEEVEIGTKATRADIIETLYRRGYIADERIMVTDLGFDIVNVLNKYCPEIISVDFTRDLEKQMDEIQNGNEKMERVIERAVSQIKPVLDELKLREEEIGKALSEAIKKARMQQRIVGNCPVCKTGRLMILHSRRTRKRFIGCTNYFKGICKTSFPLPQRGTLKPMRKNCSRCEWPLIEVRTKGKRPWRLCFNPDCPSKERKN